MPCVFLDCGPRGLALVAPAAAQSYPDRVVRIINPYPPGGSVDITARILAQNSRQYRAAVHRREPRRRRRQYRRRFGRQVGAGRLHAVVQRARPAGDQPDALHQGPAVRPDQGFRADRDLRLHADRADGEPGLPASNVQELIAFAKSNPGKIHFGSAGMGSTPHLSGELFKSMTKTEITHVPYRGTGPAMNDLVGGHIQMFFDLLPGSLPQISAGKVRALANAGARRPAALPDLPTVAEQGLPGFDSRPGSRWWRRRRPRRRFSSSCATRSARHSVSRHRRAHSRARLGAGHRHEKDVRGFIDAEAKSGPR